MAEDKINNTHISKKKSKQWQKSCRSSDWSSHHWHLEPLQPGTMYEFCNNVWFSKGTCTRLQFQTWWLWKQWSILCTDSLAIKNKVIHFGTASIDVMFAFPPHPHLHWWRWTCNRIPPIACPWSLHENTGTNQKSHGCCNCKILHPLPLDIASQVTDGDASLIKMATIPA